MRKLKLNSKLAPALCMPRNMKKERHRLAGVGGVNIFVKGKIINILGFTDQSLLKLLNSTLISVKEVR